MVKIWSDIQEFFLSRFCLSCGKKLLLQEWGVCACCWSHLPFTGLDDSLDNDMARCFWGKFPVQKAFSLFYYTKGGEVADLLHEMKYHSAYKLCRKMGEFLADELLYTNFFEGIDCILPVPLASARLRSRGYNQSELLGQGIASRTGILLCTDAVRRIRNNTTQTHESAYGRWSNTAGLFAATNAATALRGKHVLLVDDVLTTGATLVACADALSDIEGISFSVITLAWAR